jgi:hypothetical protein
VELSARSVVKARMTILDHALVGSLRLIALTCAVALGALLTVDPPQPTPIMRTFTHRAPVGYVLRNFVDCPAASCQMRSGD